jgi:CubicO group peptidase (beta-lactamase class C family)
MAGHVASGALPGLVTLVSSRGEVQVDVLGEATFGGAPMRRDTIFRISSMTKPITAAAALILVDESKLRLDEPVDRLLPELANRRVLARVDGPLEDTVPAKRSITLRDLLTFTMGFGLLWGPQDAHPIQRAAQALDLQAFGPPKPDVQPAPDEWIRRFATLPLMHQPGERWMYNTGSEILGVLVARAAGQPLDVFMHERLFEPLGMKDTAFSVPAAKIDRLATSYMVQRSGKLDVWDPVHGEWSHPPKFPSGAAGLVSTADDFLAFAQMLLDGGRRILSESSVRAMTTDQLTPAQKVEGSLAPGFWDTYGWGLGVAVTKTGRYGWDGGKGTSWRSDPEEGMLALLLTQRSEYPEFSPIYRDFWSAVTSRAK